MSALGLGLTAADSYFKEGDARVQRQRDDARYNWESQRATSEMSNLPDKTAAERSGYQLRSKQNDANLGLVDTQTDVARNKLKLEQVDTTGKLARQPDEQAAAANNAEVAKTLSEFQVQDLPRVISEKRRAGVFSDADAGTTAIAKLADLIKIGDSQQVITFMNAMNDTHPEGQRKAPVAAVGITQDPKTGEKMFTAQDAQGNPVIQMSQSQMQRIRDSIGKTDYKEVKAGDSVVALKDGRATELYRAPESQKSLMSKQGPLERDVNYLVGAHGMSKDQALSHLNSAKTMSREQFVLNALKEKAANSYGYKPSKQDADEFGALYDSVQQKNQTGAQPRQQSGSGVNWNDWVQ
jgi:hypothetical protein